MRILLRLELDCSPDAAWRAIRSPAAFTAVSAPFTTFTSLEKGGFPELWPGGDHRVLVRAFGLVDAGTQNIGISFPQTRDGVRLMQDSGPPLSGALALITRWRHRLAISALPDGRTLYRDELRFNAGAATPLIWPVLWAFWQWRGVRLRQLAPSWRE
jgi:hypothetical protein